MQLSHERLHVYQKAISFLAIALRLLDELPSGHTFVRDQLKRASLSIVLNIAEGAGKPTAADRRKFYGIARGSTLECSAVLDVIRLMNVGDLEAIEVGKGLLVDVAAMLTQLGRV